MAGIEVGIGETPANATQVRLFLRNPARQTIGTVEIKRVGNESQLDIAQIDPSGTPKAVVRLLPMGDIVLEPAPTRNIILSAPVATSEIFYDPPMGGPRGVIRLLPTGVVVEQRDAGGTPQAVIRLLPTGEIRLEPLSGQQVTIAGDLETEHIQYLPLGGITKQYL